MDLSMPSTVRFTCILIIQFVHELLFFPLSADVTWSLIGCLVWTTGLIAWITVFQLKRAEWGETGDRLSFIIPRGRP